MYRRRLWTMRQYAGYGSAEDTNERFHYLLEQGQTALSVAFDLPTQLGLDSSAPDAKAEVGRVGVAIDTADDMAELFEGLPLDDLSVNFTINATAPIILAFYLVAAERQGADRSRLAGTLQNDILKEFVARKTFIFPPEPSMRLVGDVVEYCTSEVPRFNPISITGYHAREAGCDTVQELAFTMSDAIAYAELLVDRGLSFDAFAPRSLRRGPTQAPSGPPAVSGHRSPATGSARPTLKRCGSGSSRVARGQRSPPSSHSTML